MKLILVGYPGSQKVKKASEYLVKKYLPFDVYWLNYTGKIDSWSAFIADYLETFDDEKIIFALDDYLIRGPIDMIRFDEALRQKPCVKLFECTPDEHAEYPVTTQYTMWNRMELIALLRQTTSPWDFEINGSKLFKGESVVYPCLDYDTHSALSARWQGVRTDGLKEEDLQIINTFY